MKNCFKSYRRLASIFRLFSCTSFSLFSIFSKFSKFSRFSKLLIVISSILFSSTLLAEPNLNCFDFCLVPYVGADAGYRHVKYDGGGDKLFKTKYPQGALYGGLKFNNYIGIEGGYKTTILKSQFVRLDAGDQILGASLLFPPEYYIAKAQFKGWYGSVIGYLPLSSCYPVSLLGSIGLTQLKTYHFESILVDQELNQNVSFSFLENGKTFKSKRNLLTLGIGIQYVHCDTVGFRFKMDWENTGKIKNLRPLEGSILPLYLTIHNSFNYNFGVFIPF